MTPAIFLDRDGTLIRDVGYLSSEEQIEVLPHVPQALRLLKEKGFKLVVVTNQSAVARGWLTEEKLARIHEALVERLAQNGIHLAGIYYCPHHPTEGVVPYNISCSCRKPDVGLVERAARELRLDPARSYVIGDQVADMELARRIGAKGIWIGGERPTGREPVRSYFVARDLKEAARWIVDRIYDGGQIRGAE
jgi:D-glycero-D-manno-heptose 1,7-bisphosphate phosphatase